MSTQQDMDAAVRNEAAASAAPRIAFRPHHALPWMILPQGMALQVLIDAAPVAVPNTRPWFRGVISQGGNLVPVFDIAEWAGCARDPSTSTQIVSIGQGANACAVLCCETPTLLRVGEPVGDAATAGALAPFAAHAYDSALGKAHELDIQRWLAAAAAQVSAIDQ
jgi:hypothetical protein